MGRRNLLYYLLLNVFISACVTAAILFWYDRTYRSTTLSAVQPAQLVENQPASQPTLNPQDDIPVEIVSIVGAGLLDAESVTLRNAGSESLNLAGWQLKDSDKSVFVFPNLTLNPGGAVRVHTGSGTNNVIDLYWNESNAVWDSGEEARLLDSSGNQRAKYNVP